MRRHENDELVAARHAVEDDPTVPISATREQQVKGVPRVVRVERHAHVRALVEVDL